MILFSYCIIMIKMKSKHHHCMNNDPMVPKSGPPARIISTIAHLANISSGRHGCGVLGAGRKLFVASVIPGNTMENYCISSYVRERFSAHQRASIVRTVKTLMPTNVDEDTKNVLRPSMNVGHQHSRF